jgi:hypothetical protein
MMHGINLSCKFKTSDLIAKLQCNRDKHKEEYERACKVYTRELVALLEKKLEAAKKGKEVSLVINLRKPVEYLNEYDKALGMLRMTTDTAIPLDPISYAQLVMDDWEWKTDFFSNTTRYLSAHKEEEGV